MHSSPPYRPHVVAAFAMILVFCTGFLAGARTSMLNQSGHSERVKATANALSERVRDHRNVADSLRTRLAWYEGALGYDEETIWLARILYSETNRVDEMRLIAWVARNRVESCYRGDCTYAGVAQHPHQFSGLMPWHPAYQRNMKGPRSAGATWHDALQIAQAVRFAPVSLRPFESTTRHFYSPVSMPTNRRHPDWAQRGCPVAITGLRPASLEPLDEARFVILRGVL